MPTQAETREDPRKKAGVSQPEAEGAAIDSHAITVAADAEDGDETIHIELNFNAFADDVPPTQHARRAPSNTDPSVQDFADQALELAALRAELNRLARDYDALLYTLQLRDARLQKLQEELAATRSRLRDATQQARESALARGAPPTTIEPPASTLESTCKLESAAAPRDCVRRLIPLPAGEPIALRREIVTIGRTKENDVCIPSHAVSRDHARLLLGPRSVTLVDMDSANGCFVNEVRVKKQRLRHGDVLTIGDRSYRFAAGDPDADRALTAAG